MFVRLLFTALVAGGFLLATALGDSDPGSASSATDPSGGSNSFTPCVASCVEESIKDDNNSPCVSQTGSQDALLKCACQDAPLLSAIAMCVVSSCPDEAEAAEATFEQACGASVSTALHLPSGGAATITSTTLPPGGPTITDSSLSSTGSGTSSKHANSTSASASGTSTRSEHATSSSTSHSPTTTLTVQPLAATVATSSLPLSSATDTAVSSAADNSTSLSSMAPSGTIASQSPPAKTSNAALGDALVGGLHSVLFTVMGASMVALGVAY